MILETVYAVSSAWCLFHTSKSLVNFEKQYSEDFDPDLVAMFGAEKAKNMVKNGLRFYCFLSVVPYINTALMLRHWYKKFHKKGE